jgi:hypothetical protein
MRRKLGRYVVAVAAVALSVPGVAWAAETAGKVLSACCGLPCCG